MNNEEIATDKSMLLMYLLNPTDLTERPGFINQIYRNTNSQMEYQLRIAAVRLKALDSINARVL